MKTKIFFIIKKNKEFFENIFNKQILEKKFKYKIL